MQGPSAVSLEKIVLEKAALELHMKEVSGSGLLDEADDAPLVSIDNFAFDLLRLIGFAVAAAVIVYLGLLVAFEHVTPDLLPRLGGRLLRGETSLTQVITYTLYLSLPLVTALFAASMIRGRNRLSDQQREAIDRLSIQQREAIDRLQQVEQTIQQTDINNSAQLKKASDDITFARNILRSPRLEYLTIRNHPMFKELRWEYNDRVNILLGRNGYGKSLLLRILMALLANETEHITRLLDDP